MTVEPITSPPTGATVRRMACPLCEWSSTLVPPIWLGEPWDRSTALRVFAGHVERMHPEAAA